MLNTYLRPLERLRSVAGPWRWLTEQLWNELLLEAGKDSIQPSDQNECNEASGQEANACGSSPRRNKRVTVLIPTLHDVLNPTGNGGVDGPGIQRTEFFPVVRPAHKAAALRAIWATWQLRVERLTRDDHLHSRSWYALACSHALSSRRLCTLYAG